MLKLKGVHIFIAIVCLAVLASVVAGFIVVGSPKEQRAKNLDAQRINDLQQITYAVDAFYNQTGNQRLPSSLDELRRAQNVYVNSIFDPGTAAQYEYAVVDALDYQLCANFDTVASTALTAASQRGIEQQEPYAVSTFWDHPAGRQCYTLKVNANLNVK